MTAARRSPAASKTAGPAGDYVGTDIPPTAGQLAAEPHVGAWIVTALGVVGVVVLAALGKPVPEALTTMIGVGGGAAAGLSFPRGSS